MFCVKPQAEPPHHVSAATGKGPFPRPRAGAGRTCVPSSFGSIPRSTLAGWRAKSVFSFVRNRPCVAPPPPWLPRPHPHGQPSGGSCRPRSLPACGVGGCAPAAAAVGVSPCAELRQVRGAAVGDVAGRCGEGTTQSSVQPGPPAAARTGAPQFASPPRPGQVAGSGGARCFPSPTGVLPAW